MFVESEKVNILPKFKVYIVCFLGCGVSFHVENGLFWTEDALKKGSRTINATTRYGQMDSHDPSSYQCCYLVYLASWNEVIIYVRVPYTISFRVENYYGEEFVRIISTISP
uniref:Uncharacterized protein n=1 Tax=Attheya septentrionalis TaxID=420275 RepID=A0A7S2UN73_9STRA|mmetsp:Transcript_5592/g.9852  ORF Transcript_5592/g.9852 Transcript_5592/m.9852 type:complete len:111 (+) Transcript_5592:85-417(+)